MQLKAGDQFFLLLLRTPSPRDSSFKPPLQTRATLLLQPRGSPEIFFFSLGPHPWHMEVPRLGVESEL